MAHHAQRCVETRLPAYFCNPRSQPTAERQQQIDQLICKLGVKPIVTRRAVCDETF